MVSTATTEWVGGGSVSVSVVDVDIDIGIGIDIAVLFGSRNESVQVFHDNGTGGLLVQRLSGQDQEFPPERTQRRDAADLDPVQEVWIPRIRVRIRVIVRVIVRVRVRVRGWRQQRPRRQCPGISETMAMAMAMATVTVIAIAAVPVGAGSFFPQRPAEQGKRVGVFAAVSPAAGATAASAGGMPFPRSVDDARQAVARKPPAAIVVRHGVGVRAREFHGQAGLSRFLWAFHENARARACALVHVLAIALA